MYLIIDSYIKKRYSKELEFLNHIPTFEIEANDLIKNLDQVEEIINWMVVNRASKSSVILSIGGGFIQDLSTFVAHVFHRGISWIFIPTTLLSQSDSCIGSKCGINVMHYKNQVGVFHAPIAIFIVEEFLETLSPIEKVSGLGEILKLSLIGENPYYSDFKDIVKNRSKFQDFFPLVNQSLKAKKAIIELDEYESNLRRVLNYGHSFGHALEAISNYKIPHGIAVLLGIDIINYLGTTWGITDISYYIDIQEVIKYILKIESINIEIPKFETAELIDALKKDKKILNSRMNFAVLKYPGCIEIIAKEIDDQLFQTVKEYLETSELFSIT
jgi:3-dehydroquinate synthase